jgi:hypothetical protein
MPNRHTVAGIQADIKLDNLTAGLVLGYNQDRFPFDDNARENGVNEIEAVAAGNGFVVFGHHGGVTVETEGEWETYGASSGLAGRTVQAIAFVGHAVYLGTDTGLTVVRLDGASPFDRAANWESYFTGDDGPDSSITALLQDDGMVWIGTEGGLVTVPSDSIDLDADWTMPSVEGIEDLPPIRALAMDAGTLYVGTDRGVYSYDTSAGTLELITGTGDESIRDLAISEEGTLYVASEKGLREFHDGIGANWIVVGQDVHAVIIADETVYYGTDTGLTSLEQAPQTTLSSWGVTALAQGEGGVWVGVRASDTYDLTVWRVAQREQGFASSVTGIPGKDPYVFLDIAAADHTVTGWMSSATFSQSTDAYSLSGAVSIYPPTFRRIGSTSRSDTVGWTISGTFPLGDWGSLALDHDYRMMGQSGDAPQDEMDNSLTLSGHVGDGPKWKAAIGAVTSNAEFASESSLTRRTTSSLSVSDTFFRDALDLRLTWSRTGTDTEPWTEQWLRQSLALNFDWKLLPTLSTDGSWSRPIRRFEDDVAGNESIKWNWDWTPSISFGGVDWTDMDASYSLTGTHTLFADEWDWTHKAEMRFDITSIHLRSLELVPDVTLSGEHDSASTDLRAELAVRTTLEDLTVRSTIRGNLTDLGRPVTHREGTLSVNVKYQGWPDLDPSLTYNGSRRLAVKGDQSALTSSDSINGRLVWSPAGGPRDELTCSVKSDRTQTTNRFTASLDNRLTFSAAPWVVRVFNLDVSDEQGLPLADVRVNTTAAYRGGTSDTDLSFSTKGELVGSLSERWNVSFGTTLTAGVKSTVGLYSSVLFELTFAINL